MCAVNDTTYRHLRLEWYPARTRRDWPATKGNQVVFSDESRFNFSSDDNRVRVSRTRGKCLNPAFALQRHTSPTAGVMVWSAIAYDIRLPLILILGTLTAQRHVLYILQPHVLPLMARLSGDVFLQDNARPHRAKMHKTAFSTLPPFPGLLDPQICHQLSISEIIWDSKLGSLRF
ncbi:transposable element Tcb2 transposase [Trichonephila clavipes]|nr:transposable element Tcb2 transposase [Trichonephila clavipes]